MLTGVAQLSRVLVAMSGGVDSSVAAARLVDAGHEVVGVTLHLWDYPGETPAKSRCCAPEDIHDAARVADALGIAHYAFDRRELFERRVVQPFVKAYLEGRTPSPCVWCNRYVKMPELLALTQRLGAAAFATGHYARVVRDDSGAARLHRGRDRSKDQSYFLYRLRAEQLDRLRLPLGEALKQEVRAEARARRLPGADKGESQELCFVAAGGYACFVESRAPAEIRQGPIEDARGRPLGRHHGIHRYTVGQRRGLGVALGHPAFVTAIDPERHAVRVGTAAEASARGAVLGDTAWHDDVEFPCEAWVKVRSQHEGAPATLDRAGSEASAGQYTVRFQQSVRGVAPGQVAVAFRGERVLGGGTIVAAEPEEALT